MPAADAAHPSTTINAATYVRSQRRVRRRARPPRTRLWAVPTCATSTTAIKPPDPHRRASTSGWVSRLDETPHSVRAPAAAAEPGAGTDAKAKFGLRIGVGTVSKE